MKSRLLFLSLGAPLLLLGALAAACGGGGEALTLEEYFQRAGAAGDETDPALVQAAFEQPPPGPEASGEEIAASARRSLDAQVAILTVLIDALRDIDPPEEVEDAHEEWLAAWEAGRAALQDQAQGIPESPSREEAEDLFFFGNPGFEEIHRPVFAAFGRVEDACAAVQGIADANNIDVDLECKEIAEEE